MMLKDLIKKRKKVLTYLKGTYLSIPVFEGIFFYLWDMKIFLNWNFVLAIRHSRGKFSYFDLLYLLWFSELFVFTDLFFKFISYNSVLKNITLRLQFHASCSSPADLTMLPLVYCLFYLSLFNRWKWFNSFFPTTLCLMIMHGQFTKHWCAISRKSE